MAQFIEGRSLAQNVLDKLPARIQKLPRKPGLAVLLVGSDPASQLYVKFKQQAAERIGVRFTFQRMPERASFSTVLGQVDAWNADPEIDGILVQLPLPKTLKEQTIVERVDPEKDVDGFHPVNTGRYLGGERTNPPGLVEGILRLIATTGVNVNGMPATIVARESVFSQCLEHALAMLGVLARTVPTDGSHHNATIDSDVVVVAAGKPRIITGDDLKPGSIVIDVGINPLPDGSVVGDVDTATASKIVAWISPVPGGVGPMTVAMLLENVVRLAERNQT